MNQNGNLFSGGQVCKGRGISVNGNGGHRRSEPTTHGVQGCDLAEQFIDKENVLYPLSSFL